ncbi:MAG TPA: hypothetical protein VF268_01835 [Gammaproteobacteria bacterium]
MWRKQVLPKGLIAVVIMTVVASVAVVTHFLLKKDVLNGEFHIPAQVPPYYSDTGHRADVGRYSAGLSAMDGEVVLETVGEMEKDWENLPVTAMYVAALRLFEIGERDLALYWFQGAKYRGILFVELLDGSSDTNRMGGKAYALSKAHEVFFRLLRPYIGGHGLCDIRKYEDSLQRAVFNRDVVPKLNKIYPEIVFLSEEQWPGEAEKVKENLKNRLNITVSGYDEIVKQRKAAGLHDQYCKRDSLTTEHTEGVND